MPDDIRKIIDKFDEFVQGWHDNLEKHEKNKLFIDDKEENKLFVAEYCRKQREGIYKLIPDALPEPYLGNPHAGPNGEKGCSAVIINLNPGGEIRELQHWGKWKKGEKEMEPGKFITAWKAHEKKYEKFAKDFPYKKDNTYGAPTKWWNRRKVWIDRLISSSEGVANFVSDKEPFALELCPWHSKNFGGLNLEKTGLMDYYTDNILPLAAYAIENSELGFGVSIGKSVRTVLEKLSPAVDLEEPTIKKRKYCYFEVESTGKKFIILNTYLDIKWPRNIPPGKKYEKYEENLIIEPIKRRLEKNSR